MTLLSTSCVTLPPGWSAESKPVTELCGKNGKTLCLVGIFPYQKMRNIVVKSCTVVVSQWHRKHFGYNVLSSIICRTLRANRAHQDLPPISRCHSYTINAKYTYRCTNNNCANTWVFRIDVTPSRKKFGVLWKTSCLWFHERGADFSLYLLNPTIIKVSLMLSGSCYYIFFQIWAAF